MTLKDNKRGQGSDYPEGNSSKKRISASLSAGQNLDFPYHFLLLCSLLRRQCFINFLEMDMHQYHLLFNGLIFYFLLSTGIYFGVSIGLQF